MNTTQGTPKTLIEACMNALNATKTLSNDEDKAKVIEAHIRDYMAQKFTVALFRDKSGAISKLWNKITGV